MENKYSAWNQGHTRNDNIEFDNKPVPKPKEEHTYILLNKPIDYVTTAKDQFGRQTVLDLVKTKKD